MKAIEVKIREMDISELLKELSDDKKLVRIPEEDRTKCPNCTNCIRDLREDKERLLKERDAAVTQAKRAEERLSHIGEYWNHCETEWAMSDALRHILATVDDYFAAAQDAKPDYCGDFTEMVSGRESQEQILIGEANRPLDDEEHAICGCWVRTGQGDPGRGEGRESDNGTYG